MYILLVHLSFIRNIFARYLFTGVRGVSVPPLAKKRIKNAAERFIREQPQATVYPRH